ncbi:Rne/Rng family ribonuclease [Dietzia alimentaria]|uniref:Rne/Rng family ribonuclease n=1 Tax=Dietzia alimentaria TaxID=665550 RepID=UPI00029A9DE0|nr:Rne/Rng family ribonuclease [Dietzia alimentaria]
MSDPNLTIDDINALPERMRAHAAAKAVGMTSKEFLVAMAGIGVEVKSAQSGVTREVLQTWFEGRGQTGGDTSPATTEVAAGPASEVPPEKPVREPAARKAPAKKTSSGRSPAKKAVADSTASDTTSAEQTAGQRTSVYKASADKASAKRPALPEIAIVTGEVGSAESGNRRRRSTATPKFSPLFLSPDEVAAEKTDRDGRAHEQSRSYDSPEHPAEDNGDTGGADGDTRRSDDQSEGGEGGARRRRRGRRGRGRGRGEGGDDQNTENADDSDDSDESDDAGRGTDGGRFSVADSRTNDDAEDNDDSEDGNGDDSDESDGAPSGSRRRRRRRRRGGGSTSDDNQTSNDDPPNTEVHERDSSRRPNRGGQGQGPGQGTSSDEVQGITGSTRLEAKRQRRRDGREAGRRRQPILSESEFLARREAVDRVMVVREKDRADGKGVMTQVGVLEDKVLVEHFVTTESARSMVGNVFLGRVQNVLPSMEAAFVDIGRGRNGVLYAGEVNWEAAGLGGKSRRIEQALRPGDMVLVQVTKDPVGQKGARLSTQISLAGRFLVYVPDGNSTGISRKLPDTERRRLKAILKEVVPEGSGVIIRTAAEGVSEEEIGRDVERLAAQWTEISDASAKRTASGAGTPVALYEEPDLLVKVVRDLFNEDFSSLVIQGETSWNTVHDYVSRVAPEMVERLQRYDNPDVDVFATHRVDEQLAKALDRKVWLPSGGSLVIDRTEAMTVVDVNTGKYTGSGGNLEETVTKNNLEAAEEIVRQLRLRDVGGMVIIDFIDMVLEANRDLVLRRLTEALGRDRTRHQVSEVTSLGLVQMTRKKLGTGLVEAFSTPCEHCQGRGLLVHADPLHTESHNADEPGSRRGRRRGGKNGESETPPAKAAAPRKDGPAPAAHPAALAISRHADDDHDDAHGGAAAGDTGAEESTAAAGATTAEVDVAQQADRSSGSKAAQAPDTAEPTEEPDSSDGAGTSRPPRRRRAARRATSAAPAPSTAAEDSAAAEVAETPKDEAAATAEASEAVQAVAAPQSSTDTSGRRPRRRSTRREAGAATDTAAPDTTTAPEARVEATALAEAPTAVVAEPRKRPARRRATRSTTAPEDN